MDLKYKGTTVRSHIDDVVPTQLTSAIRVQLQKWTDQLSDFTPKSDEVKPAPASTPTAPPSAAEPAKPHEISKEDANKLQQVILGR